MNKQVQDNPGRVQGGQAFMARVFSRRCNASAVQQDREFQVMKTSGMGRGFRCLWAGLRGRAGLLMLAALVGLMQATSAWAQSPGCAALANDWTNYTPAMYDGKALTYSKSNFLPTDEVAFTLTNTDPVDNFAYFYLSGPSYSPIYVQYTGLNNTGYVDGNATTTIPGSSLIANDLYIEIYNQPSIGIGITVSVYCTAPANAAPVNTVLPAITGTATVGNALLSSTGTWTDADGDLLSYSYQWYRADDNSGTNLAAVAGATTASRTLTTSDAHKYLRVVVTANDGNGGTQTATSAYTAIQNSAPVNIVVPSVSGTATVGNVLSTTNGSWSDADGDSRSYTYQWFRADDNIGTNQFGIGGANTASYTPTTSDAHKYLRVSVTANDGRGGVQAASSVYVQVLNSAPTDIALSNNSIGQNATGASVNVGTLTGTDPDNVAGDLTFSLVSVATATDGGSCVGDSGNGAFTISGANLRTASTLSAGSYNLCVQVSDGSLSYKKDFTVTVMDDIAPVVSSVSVPASAYYIAGQTLTFTVNISKSVTIDATGGPPRIELTIGSNTRYATYVDGSGSPALIFSYTVQAGDNDNDGINVGALGLNGSAARDAAGNNMVLTLNSVGSTSGIFVDTMAPSLLSLTPADNSLTVSPGANFAMTFSEKINLGSGNIVIYDTLDMPVVTINVASHGGQLSVNNNLLVINPAIDLNEGASYYIQVANGAIRDMAGNAYSGIANNSSWNFTVADLSPPEVTSIVVSGTPAANAAAIQFTVTFNEPPYNVSVDDFTLTTTSGNASGTIAGVTAVAGNIVTVAVNSISGTGALRLDLKANTDITDGSGNGNNTNGYVPAFTSGAVHAVDRVLPQIITFNNPGAQNFGTSPALSATSDSGLTLTLTSATTAVCTISSDGVLTFVSAGTCTIDATQPGNADYSPAAPVSQSFTVNAVAPGAPTIGTATVTGVGTASVVFTAPAFNGGDPALSYSVTPNPAVTGGPFTGTTSPITVSGLDAGISYTFTVTATNSIGTGSPSAASIAVTTAATQVITFANPGAQAFGTTPTLTATAESGLAVSFTSSTAGVCSISSTGLLAFHTTGGCTINADQAGDASHQPAPQVSRTFAVNAVAPGAPGIGTAILTGVGQAAVAFTEPSFNGGAAVTGYILTPSPAVAGGPFTGTTSPIMVNGLTPGTRYTFTVTATNGAGTGTASAPSNAVTTEATQAITFANPGAQAFGTTPTLVASVDSGLSVAFSSATPGVCSVGGDGALTFATVGDCTIHADQAGNAGTLPAPRVSQTFAVKAVVPAAPVIGAAAMTGADSVQVSFAAPGFTGGAVVTGYSVISNPGNITASGSGSPITVNGLTSGTRYTFTVTATNGVGTGAASAASNAVTTAATQVISFANPGAQAFGTTPTLVASVDSGLPLRFEASTPSVCNVTAAGMLGFASAGTCTVTVHQDGDASHLPASRAQSFSVTAVVAASPVPGEVTVVGSGEVAVHFTPSAATGETITYTVTAQPGGITASGTGSPITVRGLTDGVSYTFTVAASGQTGGSSAPSAPSAPVVPQVLQTVAFDEVGPQRFDQVPVLSARADSGLPLVFSSSTQDVCTVTAAGQLAFVRAGSCTLVVEQAGDATHRPASATRTFRIEPVPPGVPDIQTLTPVGTGQVSVAFTPPAFTGGASIDGYRVTATPQGAAAPALRTMSLRAASTPGVVTATGSGSPILVQGLADGVSYVFTVAAYNLAGEGEADSATELVAAPELSWIGDLQKMYGQADFELPLPQSNSPGAFTFTSSNPAVATVNGRTVTVVGEGSTTLTATQAATPSYLTGAVAVTLVVNARPDPTLDAQVSGGIQAQVDASVRFAQVQGDNIRDRLRQVRSGRNASSVNFALAYAGSQGVPGLTMPVGRAAEAALPSLPQGWGLWLAGTATFGKAGRNGRAGGGFDFNTGGITLGADRAVGEHVLLGMAGSWGRQGTDFDDTPSKVDADQRSLAVYGLWRMGEHLFVDGLLANGQLDFDLARWSELANASAHATRAGQQWFGSLTFGYEHRSTSGLSLTGYGRYDGHRATLDGYRERGLDAYDLAYGRQQVDNSALAMGLEGSLSFQRERLSWRPHWRIEYRGALENRGDVAVNYVQRPRDADYVLAMRSYNDDTLSLGAGMDLQLDSGWLFSLLLGREQGRNAMRSNSIGLQVRYGQQGAGVPMYGENGDEFNVDMTGDARRRCRGATQRCATPGSAMDDTRP